MTDLSIALQRKQSIDLHIITITSVKRKRHRITDEGHFGPWPVRGYVTVQHSILSFTDWCSSSRRQI